MKKLQKMIKDKNKCDLTTKSLWIALKCADNCDENVKIRLTLKQAKDIYHLLSGYEELLHTIIRTTKVKIKCVP